MKTATYIFMSSFTALSLIATLRNETYWPIAPYNMFSFFLNVRTPVLELVLSDGALETCRVRASELLPFEFFRANAIVKFSLARPAMMRALSEGLRTQEWGGFDEVHGSANCLLSDFQSLRFEMVKR